MAQDEVNVIHLVVGSVMLRRIVLLARVFVFVRVLVLPELVLAGDAPPGPVLINVELPV